MSTTINNDSEGCYSIQKNKIRKSLHYDDCVLLEINIEYPSIEDKNAPFVKKFNSIYNRAANEYLKYCENVLYNSIISISKKNEIKKPFGEVMKYFITCNNAKYISVVCDINHFDGYFFNISRYAQTWSVQKDSILPYSYFLRKLDLTSRAARKRIAALAMSELENNPSGFDYNLKGIKKHINRIDLDNFFLTKNGIAFWYEKNTIAASKDGFPAYIIESNEIFK